jgi:hypothetical protein
MCAWNVIYRITIYQTKRATPAKKVVRGKTMITILNNNLHPVWFEVNKDGSHKLDEAGEKSAL